jgi:hypothetical protein
MIADSLERLFILGSIAVLRRRAELARVQRAIERAEVYDELAAEFEAELSGPKPLDDPEPMAAAVAPAPKPLDGGAAAGKERAGVSSQ